VERCESVELAVQGNEDHLLSLSLTLAPCCCMELASRPSASAARKTLIMASSSSSSLSDTIEEEIRQISDGSSQLTLHAAILSALHYGGSGTNLLKVAFLLQEASTRSHPVIALDRSCSDESGDALLFRILRGVSLMLTRDATSTHALLAMERQRGFLLAMTKQSCFREPENALAQMERLADLELSAEHAAAWIVPFADIILRNSGLQIDKRDAAGNTLLLRCAARDDDKYPRGPLLVLLLQHGADLHAVNADGRNVLHYASVQSLHSLAHAGFLTVAAHWSMRLNLFYGRDRSEDNKERLITLRDQVHLWRTRARPLLGRMLSAHVIPDLAAIVLMFLDGEEANRAREVAPPVADESLEHPD
jgi:hypothetical protein